MLKTIKYFPAVAVLVIVAGVMVYWLADNRKEEIANHEKALIKRARANFEAVRKGYNLAANLFYEGVINTKAVKSIMDSAAKQYGTERHELRRKLYQKLNPEFQKIYSRGIRQLHFHLPDCQSFLRFNVPSQYGDNLKPTRFAVARTNKTHTAVSGFEAGRTFNGLRFIYPLTKNKNHLGSVEFGVSYNAIRRKVDNLDRQKTGMLLKQEVTRQMETTDNYYTCRLIDGYTIVKDTIQNKAHVQFFRDFFKNNQQELRDALKLNYTNLMNVKHHQNHFAVVFIPVPDIQGELIGNFVMIYENLFISQIQSEFQVRLIIVLLLFIILTALVVLTIKRGKALANSTNQLKHSQEQLTETDEVKNRLFEIITHDLRNHFNAVNGFVDLLQKQQNNPEKNKRMLTGLNDAVQLTNNLMNNLFIWSRLQTHNIEFTPELFEVSKWLEAQINNFQGIIARKNVRLINDTKGPVYIRADRDLLVYIVRNVLHNAIKYSAKNGQIRVNIVDDVKESIITVKDKGEGMSATEVSKILNTDSWAGTRTNKQAGLGLLIARKLVDYHDGTFSIDSAKGIGTTVTIKMPKRLE